VVFIMEARGVPSTSPSVRILVTSTSLAFGFGSGLLLKAQNVLLEPFLFASSPPSVRLPFIKKTHHLVCFLLWRRGESNICCTRFLKRPTRILYPLLKSQQPRRNHYAPKLNLPSQSFSFENFFVAFV
jgi:hypothetical protein